MDWDFSWKKKIELKIEDFPFKVDWRFLSYLTSVQKGQKDPVTARILRKWFLKINNVWFLRNVFEDVPRFRDIEEKPILCYFRVPYFHVRKYLHKDVYEKLTCNHFNTHGHCHKATKSPQIRSIRFFGKSIDQNKYLL